MHTREEIYSPYQASVLLDVHYRTVIEYIKAGYLKANLSPTGRYKIPQSAIDHYFKNCEERTLSLFP
jgi:predicted site-specific integrase-resolvase